MGTKGGTLRRAVSSVPDVGNLFENLVAPPWIYRDSGPTQEAVLQKRNSTSRASLSTRTLCSSQRDPRLDDVGQPDP
jgi:hypothetical protein